MSLGNAAAAERILGPVAEMMATSGLSEAAASAFVPDQVEALVSLGELDRAQELVERFLYQAEALDRASRSPPPLAAGPCSRLATAGLESATSHWIRRLVEHKRALVPIERGRTLLVKGSLHRRRREKRAAKEALEDAFANFEGIGAIIWVERARAELRRVGLRPRAPQELTATESRVAELAASGLSTKLVAALAFSPPRASRVCCTAPTKSSASGPGWSWPIAWRAQPSPPRVPDLAGPEGRHHGVMML